MKGIYKMFVLMLVMLALLACSKGVGSEKASDLATGRWATADGKMIVLVDIPKGVLKLFQVSNNHPSLIIDAENLKIESEQKEPHEVLLSYDFSGKHPKTIIRIKWQEDNHFIIALVNTLTGVEQPLNFVSANPTLGIQ